MLSLVLHPITEALATPQPIEATKLYNPSRWEDGTIDLTNAGSSNIPTSLTVLQNNSTFVGDVGNSGNHVSVLYYNDLETSTTTPKVVCIFRGGADQSRPYSTVFMKNSNPTCNIAANIAQRNKGLVYKNPKCYTGDKVPAAGVSLPAYYNANPGNYPITTPVPLAAGAKNIRMKLDHGDSTSCNTPASCCGDVASVLAKTTIAAQLDIQSNPPPGPAPVVVQDLTYTAKASAPSGLKIQYLIGGRSVVVTYNSGNNILTTTFPVGTTSSSINTTINSSPASNTLVSSTISGNPNNPQTAPAGPFTLKP